MAVEGQMLSSCWISICRNSPLVWVRLGPTLHCPLILYWMSRFHFSLTSIKQFNFQDSLSAVLKGLYWAGRLKADDYVNVIDIFPSLPIFCIYTTNKILQTEDKIRFIFSNISFWYDWNISFVVEYHDALISSTWYFWPLSRYLSAKQHPSMKHFFHIITSPRTATELGQHFLQLFLFILLSPLHD